MHPYEQIRPARTMLQILQPITSKLALISEIIIGDIRFIISKFMLECILKEEESRTYALLVAAISRRNKIKVYTDRPISDSEHGGKFYILGFPKQRHKIIHRLTGASVRYCKIFDLHGLLRFIAVMHIESAINIRKNTVQIYDPRGYTVENVQKYT